MFGLKRCYGCSKVIWWWEDAVDTETVGYVHRECLFAATIKKASENLKEAFFHITNEQAAKELGVKEEK